MPTDTCSQRHTENTQVKHLLTTVLAVLDLSLHNVTPAEVGKKPSVHYS